MRSRLEAPQFIPQEETQITYLPFCSKPIVISARGLSSVKHFLVLGRDRDALAYADIVRPDGLELKGYTHNSDIKPVSASIPVGGKALIGKYGVELLGTDAEKQTATVVIHSKKRMPEPLHRNSNNPTRILQRMERRKKRWKSKKSFIKYGPRNTFSS